MDKAKVDYKNIKKMINEEFWDLNLDDDVKGKACLSDCDPGDCGRFKFCLTVNTNDDYCFYIYALNSDEIMEICNNDQFLKFSSVIDVDPPNIVDNNLTTCYGHKMLLPLKLMV